MNRERILAILYEMALVIGGETRLQPLVTKTLQRLLFHTSFPCGMVLLYPEGEQPPEPCPEYADLHLEASIGDHELARFNGSTLRVPADLLRGGMELSESPEPITTLPCRKDYYRVVLRLPIENCGMILLLAPRMPATELPLTRIFQPVLSNFAKAILLCRSNEAYTQGIITDRDVAEQEKEKLHEQLLQAQKMEAIGQLAGGIAHDFNNILTVIMGFSDILRMKIKQDDPLRPSVDHVLEAAQRAANLTRSLLAFSRKQAMNPKTENLNDIVRGVEKFLGRVIGEDIQLETDFKEEVLLIHADSGQIGQVLMNLATNARDAIPNGGRLIIQTEAVELDSHFIKSHGYGKIGRYALISVTDTGTGMDKETCKKIFEPFFTTKGAGQGTGLGLAIAYGIVKQHNGYINAYSEPGQGTTFRIFLPLLSAEQVLEQPSALTFPQGGTETILLAEDEATIRSLLASTLKDFGYTVIEAEDGNDAIAKFREHGPSINLLVFDVIMPGKSGAEAYEEIRKQNPGIKILFLTGYAADLIRSKGLVDEHHELLMKPIFPVDLVRKIEEMLQ
jgi:signal transduction histidine kinase